MTSNDTTTAEGAPRVGFVGLGHMGWPMAHNLVDAGIRLTVRDSDDAAQQRFVAEHDCRGASSPADFADVDVVVTMLPNGRIIHDVLLAWQGGIASALAAGSLILDMSSSAPTDTVELAAVLSERSIGVVDAPVSGGLIRATDGTLSIMVGGDDDMIARALPLLDVLGDPARRFVCGGLASGHAMKALNNFVGAANYAATVEALAVGQAFGLAPKTMVETINASTGRSFESEVVLEHHVVNGAYATGFGLGLLAKDVAIAASLAHSVGVDAPTAELMDARWRYAESTLGGGRDHSEAHQAWWDIELTAG